MVLMSIDAVPCSDVRPFTECFFLSCLYLKFSLVEHAMHMVKMQYYIYFLHCDPYQGYGFEVYKNETRIFVVHYYAHNNFYSYFSCDFMTLLNPVYEWT